LACAVPERELRLHNDAQQPGCPYPVVTHVPSGVRAVNLGAVVDVEDVDGASVLLNSVDDSVGAAAGSVTAG
jgi:hypothetical protein